MDDLLTQILRASSKHPNSRVSKLIHTIEEDPSQKNIVLLLIELADHAEYSIDFNISLKYYLDLFESLGIDSDLVLNEAGLLLVNSSKLYSKRVDYVQSLVERQILTLSNADNELQQQKLKQQQEESSTESTAPVEKPKRGRKRALEAPSDPYEVELAPKKFKKLNEEKRFAVQKTATKAKSLQRNIEMEQHIHPAGWMHATIHDLENEEDVDTKRNYKLFTYHIEHRYNTLVPDINFRLHFKVKDYMDAQEEEMDEDEACNTDRTWPPLSEAYVQKYIKLENYVLQQDIKSNKRKAMTREEEDDDDDMQNTEDLTDKQDDIHTESQLNDTVNNMDISVQNLNTSEINESKNDSGLGQSLLDESNKTDATMNATQLDITAANTSCLDNTTLEASAITDNLNDTILQETDKSLNTTHTQQENDSALGTSILDQSNNNELNSSAEMSGNLDTKNCNETLNGTSAETSGNLDTTENPNRTVCTESGTETLNGTSTETSGNLDTNTTNGSENKESAENSTSGNLDTTSGFENPNGTSAETSGNLDTISSPENPNETSTETKFIENSENMETPQGLEGHLDAETREENLDSTETKETSDYTTELKENSESLNLPENAQIIDNELLIKATENRKDSAIGDDRHLSISTENLAITSGNENALTTLNIDVVDAKDGDHSKIRVHLPHTDDEGVYFSDLEDQDQRMLSPTIALTNILPGVHRKDVTIYMDEELRKALELRDGIMEHFGRETYSVPVVTEPTKQPLLFNILKLPEKIIRKRALFKLGSDMDLFLQARSLKRIRPDPQPREYRTAKLLQWYSLSNTDMSGICMTPPNSPGHCSEFCGFTDSEGDNDDVVSCSEFCGFSAEEQHAIQLKNLQRLSRDSGVGVEINQLTPEKERLEIIFEESEETSAENVENCKQNLNFVENNEPNNESTESILNQLPSDIRDILTAEISDETKENNTESGNTETKNETTSQEEGTENMSTENSSELLTNSTNNTEETEKMSTENSSELLGQSTSELANSTNNTEETEKMSTENSSELLEQSTSATEGTGKLSTETASENIIEQSTETILSSEEQQSTDKPCETTENATELTRNVETESENKVSDESNKDVGMPCDEPKSTEEFNKTAENDTENRSCMENDLDHNNTFANHHADNDEDSEDDTVLDLNIQGTKTKIQQWHAHLQPILAKSRERHHFDVFKLGTEIIETVQSKNQPDEETMTRPIASFSDIMDNKDQSYVSRYFLSTLLLANQSNVEILLNNKSSECPSSWKDIQLKLLSTKRHTVAIEDNIGMISNKKKVTQKESDPNGKRKSNVIKPTQMEVDDEEEDGDDEPLVKLKETSTKISKKSKMTHKRISDNLISPIAEKRLKEVSLTTPNSILRPNEPSASNIITNVQILPPLIRTTTTTSSLSPSSFPSSLSMPQLNTIMDKPSTSRQAKDLQALKVNLNSVRTLQPIEKVPRFSDDYDSGIFSIDELST